MRARPILFSSEMVRAILDGRKTQTRRVITQPIFTINNLPPAEQPFQVFVGVGETIDWFGKSAHNKYRELPCPYGQPGDRLYVRETWAMEPCFDHLAPKDIAESARSMDRCYYRHGGKVFTEGWHRLRPSIHMPRWASRIDLEVTSVRVERVQDICELECYAEGISRDILSDPEDHMERVRENYHVLWDLLNSKRGYPWDSNPWVWVVEFAPATPQEDR